MGPMPQLRHLSSLHPWPISRSNRTNPRMVWIHLGESSPRKRCSKMSPSKPHRSWVYPNSRAQWKRWGKGVLHWHVRSFSSRCVGMGLLWPTAVTPGSCLNNKFWPQLRSWQINRPALTAKLHQLQMRHHTNKDLALFGDFIHSMSPWVSVRAEVRSIPGRTENHYRPVPKASQSKHQLSWIPFMKFHEFSWPNPCIHIFSGDGLTHSSPPAWAHLQSDARFGTHGLVKARALRTARNSTRDVPILQPQPRWQRARAPGAQHEGWREQLTIGSPAAARHSTASEGGGLHGRPGRPGRIGVSGSTRWFRNFIIAGLLQ